MIEALRSGDVPFHRHLEKCEVCRRDLEFLRLSNHLEALDLVAPSPRAYHRHGALPLSVSNWLPRRTETGKLARDSWTGLPATVTRDSAMGLERSLRFTSGPISLELVADRTPEGWRFAARCYRGSAPSGEFILKIGGKRIPPGLYDCYAWTSLQPPRKIQLLSPSLRLVFETGSW
jgi:hypothetical protein